MAPSDLLRDVVQVSLEDRDLEQCMSLSSAAGWNQTVHDWQFHLRTGKGIGLKLDSGELVATGVVLAVGRDVGWIAMVLVSERYRRRGLGLSVMERLLADAEFKRWALDATEQGKDLYQRLGFQPLENIVRHRLSRTGQPPQPSDIVESQPPLKPPFQGLARALAKRPDVSVLSRNTAYALVRAGRLALHLGPLVAESEADAAALVASLVDRSDGDLIIDVPARLGTFTRRLERFGLIRERPFVRMARGGSFFVDPGHFAIAGPEFG